MCFTDGRGGISKGHVTHLTEGIQNDLSHINLFNKHVVLQCKLCSPNVQIYPLVKIKSNKFLKLSKKHQHVTNQFVGMVEIMTDIVVLLPITRFYNIDG